MANYCSNCGERVQPDSKFCSHCGEPVKDPEAAGGSGHDGADSGTAEWGAETAEGRSEPGGGVGKGQGQEWGATEAGEPVEQPDRLQVPRKDVISTVRQAFGWLVDEPMLIGAFLVVSLISVAGQTVTPVFNLLNYVLGLLVGGISYILVDRNLRGESFDFETAAGEVVDHLLSLIAIAIVYFITIVIGFILLVIPGIYLALRLSLAYPACVLDGKDFSDSLKTSWDVAQGNLLKLLGIFVLIFVPAFGIALLASIAGGASTFENPVILVALSPVTAIVSGVIQMGIARVYLENR